MDATADVATSGTLSSRKFLGHWKAIRAAKEEHHDNGMEVARLKKEAKSDGVNLDALRMVEKLFDLDDDERDVMMRLVHTYADWLSLPLARAAAESTPSRRGRPRAGNGRSVAPAPKGKTRRMGVNAQGDRVPVPTIKEDELPIQ